MTRRFLAPLVAAVICAGCGGGGGVGQIPLTTANLSAVTLQFAVGTVNALDPQTSGPANALNFVETFRQPNGLTGLLQDTATITGPANFIVGNSLTAPPYDGTAANVVAASLAGVYAYGFGFGTPGTAGSTGYGKPAGSGFPALSLSLAGPPAFPRVDDGNFPAGFSGYPLGIFAYIGPPAGITPAVGSYTLAVSTSAGSSQSNTWQASAKLATLTQLPAIVTPALTFDGQGGGAVSLTVPPRVTEIFVTIAASSEYCYPLNGQTNAQAQQANFTLFLRPATAGSVTLPIPDNLGPPAGRTSLPTFCSAAQNKAANPSAVAGGASASVQIVGVDYPLYEASYPQNTSQTPVISGSVDPDGNPNHQADVTISPALAVTSP